MKNAKHLIVIGMVVILAILLVLNPITIPYIHALKNAPYISVGQHNSLYSKIEKEAKNYTVRAQNAKIDPVWKAIPGYNGVKVDVNASYKKMKKDGHYNVHKLVFKQVSPTVHLKDLPAAPIYRGNPNKPMVSLLINVAWGNEYLPDMLKVLKKYNVHATFFLEGRWAKENPDLAKLIADSGNEIGNHSYTHPDMKILSRKAIQEQLKSTNEVIEAITKQKVKWFAPPSGSYRDDVVKIAQSMKMGTVMWTVDTVDWQKPSPKTIVQRVNSKVEPGSLILMHPTKSTAKALEPMIKAIMKKQLRIGTLSKLVDEERIIKNDKKIVKGKNQH
ncbi:polysaccharide deacetylase family protein [Heyndrickxia ginsengihumi]|uniref:Polysaccharide deacetylase family protein n=1 Tax=Heyndrickxia ginsengihumi TaxID=363870 RepID=A0A0A6VGH1_9BACI|nr:polysaccharide deacetylase family protein [Heyndrickxia ginsengihumi]KHD86543.1 hypothetical protein NG54_02560 [Heyndrickxia ginsengihumi]MBE6182801.1 hypothetical protein [Bacillus sp. (in: firmicutes)]MCM3022541.1 polysaccharide deacetylase family protein [Heyndrickxia ginsengihumi]NEY19661.1 polysaccharide deacetylase family protein [Heyndrickxia ginsengihumi]